MYCVEVVDMEAKGSFSGCREKMEKMDGWRDVKFLDETERRLAGRKLNFTWKICNIKLKF